MWRCIHWESSTRAGKHRDVTRAGTLRDASREEADSVSTRGRAAGLHNGQCAHVHEHYWGAAVRFPGEWPQPAINFPHSLTRTWQTQACKAHPGSVLWQPPPYWRHHRSSGTKFQWQSSVIKCSLFQNISFNWLLNDMSFYAGEYRLWYWEVDNILFLCC